MDRFVPLDKKSKNLGRLQPGDQNGPERQGLQQEEAESG